MMALLDILEHMLSNDVTFIWFHLQRIAENFDIEIKRWAAGKEGNLRALLSTLQYVRLY